MSMARAIDTSDNANESACIPGCNPLPMGVDETEPNIDLTSDDHFMRQALREAHKAYQAGEVPVGAVVAKEGRIIARAWNQVETLKDATAHAEMLALTAAQEFIGDWRLEGCTLYVTKEPCPMCAGAIVHCRPERVVCWICSRCSRSGSATWQRCWLAPTPSTTTPGMS